MSKQEILVNGLNDFQIEEYSSMGNELEYVLIDDTKENRDKLNKLACLVNNWTIVPEHYAPSVQTYINNYTDEGNGYLCLAMFLGECITINIDNIYFDGRKDKMGFRLKEEA